MATNVQHVVVDENNLRQAWKCHICTFANGWKETRCKMCVTNRKDEYTKGIEDQLYNANLENTVLKKELKIKDTENMALKLQIEKLKQELCLLECHIDQFKVEKFKNNELKTNEASVVDECHSLCLNEEKVKEKEDVPVILHGYMFKKSKSNSNYKKQWFLLTANNTLLYYAKAMQNSDRLDELALGEINLYLVTEIKQQRSNYTFHLVTHRRTYSLRVSNDKEFNQWFHTIKLSVRPSLICQGWLHKKKESKLSNKSWNLRYFLLCKGFQLEMRYFEDEKCKKYKGVIDCTNIKIKDMTLLPNAYKLQQYGKDLLLELTTKHRTYIFAANDIISKRLWYESLKKVSEIPHISHSRNTSLSTTIPTIPQTPKKKHKNKVKNMPNASTILVLQPISESRVQQSNDNKDIDCDEWGDCFAESSIKMSPNSDNGNEYSYMSQNTEMLMDIGKNNRDRNEIDVIVDNDNGIDDIMNSDDHEYIDMDVIAENHKQTAGALRDDEFKHKMNDNVISEQNVMEDIFNDMNDKGGMRMSVNESPTYAVPKTYENYAPSLNQNYDDAELIIHAPFDFKAVI